MHIRSSHTGEKNKKKNISGCVSRTMVKLDDGAADDDGQDE